MTAPSENLMILAEKMIAVKKSKLDRYNNDPIICLKCRRLFRSEGPLNRICWTCNATNSSLPVIMQDEFFISAVHNMRKESELSSDWEN